MSIINFILIKIPYKIITAIIIIQPPQTTNHPIQLVKNPTTITVQIDEIIEIEYNHNPEVIPNIGG